MPPAPSASAVTPTASRRFRHGTIAMLTACRWGNDRQVFRVSRGAKEERDALVDIGNHPARDRYRGRCDRSSRAVRARHPGAVHVRVRVAEPYGLTKLESVAD